MSYDHLLLPSGAAATADAADAYLTAQQGLPEGDQVAAIAAELNKRNDARPEEDSFLSAGPLRGQGDILHVPSPYDAIGYVRSLLFELATPRGYAVYDPQLAWLIDPAGNIPVIVTHGGAGEFPYLTKKLVDQWIPELSGPGPYLIVERESQFYIQTFRDDSGRYTLEYRDGAPDRHFGTGLTDAGQVADVIWGWTNGDRTSLDALSWEPVDLD